MHQNNRRPMSKRRSQRLIEAKTMKEKGYQGLERSTDPTILTLPTETLLIVMSFLEKPWRLSLALTCKFFATLTLEHSKSFLTREDRVEFLSTLQKDIPDTYFCYCCARLRPLDPSLEWRAQLHAESARPFENSHWLPRWIDSRHIQLPKSYNLFLDRARISFMEANLIMHRHFYGYSHGLPLKSLERYEAFEAVIKLDQCLRQRICLSSGYRPWSRKKPSRRAIQLPGRSLEAIPRAENAWRFSFRYTPKIIDNKLYLARFINIAGPHVPMEHLNRLIESIEIPICHHLSCSANRSCCDPFVKSPLSYLRYYPHIQARLPLSDPDNGKKVEFDPKQDSCYACSTDYDVSLSRTTGNNETSLSINAYHCLGSCRSPNDKLWAYFVTSDGEIWNFRTSLPLTKDEVFEDAPPPSMFDENAGTVYNHDHSHWAQKLKSRIPALDRGGPRRKWHEATCLE
ncbi:hypothetical protein V8C26DRAFT_394706 [Trichoderma gracile]